MNKVSLIGRLTKDPEIRYLADGNSICIARYNLAVDRRYKRDDEQSADFISCVSFGKSGEFAEKYLHKGMKIGVSGRLQTGSYTKDDGTKVYTTDVVVEEHYFCESKGSTSGTSQERAPSYDGSFMDIDENMDDLPFQ